MKTETSSSLTAAQFARLKRLSELPDEAIDTSDIPEVTDWTGAKRGLFYAGTKDRVSVAVDADLLAWFKARYSSIEESEAHINQALRSYIAEHAKKAG